MTSDLRPYRGRFAPSPTGDLHFGSLVAAVASFLEARSRNGQWLIRIEDIDPPREVAGSAERILRDVRRLGMAPDGPVLYQSTREKAYQDAVDWLLEHGEAYWCGCSRSDLPKSGIYPGTCRGGVGKGLRPRSIRIRTIKEEISFTDEVQGQQRQSVENTTGDFVIWRADGLPAYQLAVVVDDAFQGVTHVVRGADLLDSSPRQILLQRRLGFQSPAYAHVPVVLGQDGLKLSKRLRADPVSNQAPKEAISAALRFLGQDPPQGTGLAELWDWALANWNLRKVPRKNQIPQISGP